MGKDKRPKMQISKEEREEALREARELDAMTLEERFTSIEGMIKSMNLHAAKAIVTGDTISEISYKAGAAGMEMAVSILRGTFEKDTEDAFDAATETKNPLTIIPGGSDEIN